MPGDGPLGVRQDPGPAQVADVADRAMALLSSSSRRRSSRPLSSSRWSSACVRSGRRGRGRFLPRPGCCTKSASWRFWRSISVVEARSRRAGEIVSVSRARARRRPRPGRAEGLLHRNCSVALSVGEARHRRGSAVPWAPGPDRGRWSAGGRPSCHQRPVSTTNSRRCSVAPPVLDRGARRRRAARAASLQVEEDRPALQVVATRSRTSSRTTSKSGCPGVTHSRVGSVASSVLVENDLPVLAAQLAEARLQPLADRPERAAAPRPTR